MLLSLLLFLFKLTNIICLILFMLFVISVLTFRFIIEPIKKGKCTCKTNLNGKVAMVTGGNSGIGLETARNLAKRGAKVIIASRNMKKSEEAVKFLQEETGNRNVECKFLDLSQFKSVRDFVGDFLKHNERLDILVNNSGVAGIKNKITEDGINNVMQINYVAPFLLTHLLKDKLIESHPSRIVIVSSYLHRWANLDPENIAGNHQKGAMALYNNSKLCGVLWAKALAKRLPGDVIVNTLHPGAVKTAIFNKLSGWRKTLLMFTLDLLFKNAEEGAQTVIHLCVSPNIKRSGDYYVDCNRYSPAKQAYNVDLVEKVFNETMKLISKEAAAKK